MRRRETYIDIASGTAKLYMTGFCLSILTGGLLFRKATKDHVFQVLTGADQYTWSPLFLIGVAVATEVVLRLLFGWLSSKHPSSTERPTRKGSKVFVSSGTPLGASIYEEEDDEPSILDENAFLDPLVTASSPRRLSEGTFRNRRESDCSVDDFFDCRSNFSDPEEDAWAGTSVAASSVNESEVGLYRNNKCVYPDRPMYIFHYRVVFARSATLGDKNCQLVTNADSECQF